MKTDLALWKGRLNVNMRTQTLVANWCWSRSRLCACFILAPFLVRQVSRRQIILYYVEKIRQHTELKVHVHLNIQKVVRLYDGMSTARIYQMFRY